MTTIFLLVGVSSFPDPGNWGTPNKVECLGSGGRGGDPYFSPLAAEGGVEPEPQAARYGGGGGGGGGYVSRSNIVSPSFPVPVNVIGKNSVGSPTSPGFASTWWLDYQNITAGSMQATFGTSANTTTGAQGGRHFSPEGLTGSWGGDGGSVTMAITGYAGGGGGGAGGPHGAGATGSMASGPTLPGRGGTADNNYTASPGATGGTAGVNGIQWDATHGCGSGGTGGISGVAGGIGGTYGGGGGGAFGDSVSPGGGSGQDGLLVITYAPPVPDTTTRAMIMM